MPSETAVTLNSAQEVLAIVEHLDALLESREIVLEFGDNEQLLAIEQDMARYAVRCPDAIGQYVKICKAKQESIKTLRRILADPYTRKEGMWESREAYIRSVALMVTSKCGDLQGDVFTISRQDGQRYVYVENEDLVPPEYVDVIPEKRVVNTAKVEAALKANKKVPGCRLERRGPHVRIS